MYKLLDTFLARVYLTLLFSVMALFATTLVARMAGASSWWVIADLTLYAVVGWLVLHLLVMAAVAADHACQSIQDWIWRRRASARRGR